MSSPHIAPATNRQHVVLPACLRRPLLVIADPISSGRPADVVPSGDAGSRFYEGDLAAHLPAYFAEAVPDRHVTVLPSERPCSPRGPSGTIVEVPIPRRLLAEDEVVLLDHRPHWVMLSGPSAWLLAALGGQIAVAARFSTAPTLVVQVLWVLIAVAAAWVTLRTVRWWRSAHVVTTERVIQRSGRLGRRFAEVPLAAVTGVQPRRRLRDQVIGTGALVVEMAGVGRTWTITEVRAPRVMARVVQRARLDHLPSGPAIVDETWVGIPHAACGTREAHLSALHALYRHGLLTTQELREKQEALLGRH